ncbi:flagellar hook-associated protein FlgL [Alcaligenaceae bacterium]|nr:flagellar hook-associated protein FlgL [Alcaligenaceae bacterium]
MRISSNLLFQTGLNSMNAQQSDLMHLYQQIGSGQRMVIPSDDPLAAAQAINLSQSQAQNARFNENRNVAMQNLGVEDNTLSSVVLLMQNIKTTMIEAGNGTMSDADRATLSGVLSSAKDTLLGLANATDGNGQYLFSGSKGNVIPFDGNGNYQGDTRQRNIQIDQTRQLPTSDIGSDIFSRVSPGSNSYLTNASPHNAGTGVVGTPTIIDAGNVKPGTSYEIVFTTDTEYTVNVIPADPSAAPISGTINLNDKTQKIEIPGHGLQVSFSGAPEAGDYFTLQPAESTSMNVFEAMQNMIDALAFAQGAGSAEDQAKAQAQFQNVLANSMQRMDLNYDNVLTVQSSVGTRMNEIDAVKDNGALRNMGVTRELSRLEDVDYYTATAQLQLRNSALQAAMMAFVKIQQTTMLNISGR